MRKYLLLIPFILFAGDMSRIQGRVIDYSGEPINDAVVFVKGTKYQTQTDKNGYYTTPYLMVGTYPLCATAQGYDTLVYLNVSLRWDRATYLDFHLKAASDSSTYHVVDSTGMYEYGFLIGKITDEITGEPIPHATIIIEKVMAKRPNYRMRMICSVNSDGIYYCSIVREGAYKLMADMKGYKPYVCEEIIVEPNDTTISNFSLSWSDTTGKEIERFMLEKSEVLEGEDLIIAGKYDKALKYYEKIVTRNPEDWSSWSYIALCHLELEEYKKAIDIYENKVLEIDPKSIDAMYHLAYCYRELGNVRKALEWVIKAEETEKEIQKLRGK